MSNILITGGAGFIGSHLCTELLNENHNITVYDNLMKSKSYEIKDNIKFIQADILDTEELDKAMKDIDYVFHMAAVSINYSIAHPKESLDINLIGSDNVFRLALKNKVKRVIFSSSASVYGNPKRLPMKETDRLNPVTPYCIAKQASEVLLKFYGTQGLRYNILRYFNVYGLGQKVNAYYTAVIILFIKRILSKQPPIIQGDGKQSMDFINVRDVVKANILAMKTDIIDETFNIGSGRTTSITKLAHMLVKIMRTPVEPVFEIRDVIVKQRRADIKKAKKLLRFKPIITLRNGLTELVADISLNPTKYEDD